MGVPTSTNDFKNGMTLELPDGLFSIVEFQHVKPGKGGAFVRTKLRNVRTKAVIDRTYRADEKVEQAIIEKNDMQYLYRDGDNYVFMDNVSYDQITVDPASLGSAANFIKEGDSASVSMHGETVVGVELPASTALTIETTEPGVQGDRVSGARKPATLETGYVLQVPLFIEQGEKIIVDTRTGDYISRA
ncbi:MAG: elongation factor P [Actinomycetota bacterium]|nr:elongation factor P [Actinomycetota bacterium]